MPLNRRDWLKGALASVAAGLLPFGDRPGGVLGALGSLTRTLEEGPWWLIAPLGPGISVGHGWTVRDLTPVDRGATVLALERRDGTRAHVHVCRRRGAARGLAHTQHLDLVLMNGGDGSLPSDETLGRVLLTIAKRIRRNERLATAELTALADLMSHDDRVRRFGGQALT